MSMPLECSVVLATNELSDFWIRNRQFTSAGGEIGEDFKVKQTEAYISIV